MSRTGERMKHGLISIRGVIICGLFLCFYTLPASCENAGESEQQERDRLRQQELDLSLKEYDKRRSEYVEEIRKQQEEILKEYNPLDYAGLPPPPNAPEEKGWPKREDMPEHVQKRALAMEKKEKRSFVYTQSGSKE